MVRRRKVDEEMEGRKRKNKWIGTVARWLWWVWVKTKCGLADPRPSPVASDSLAAGKD